MAIDMLSAILGVAVAAAAWAFLSLTRKRSTVPKPWTIPLIGDTLKFMKCPIKYCVSRYQAYGPVFRTSLVGFTDLHIICDPDATRHIYRSEDAKFIVPGAAFNKLFQMPDYMNIQEQHRYFRKALNLSLSPQAVAAKVPELDAIIRQHLALWANATADANTSSHSSATDGTKFAGYGRVGLAAGSKALGLSLGVDVMSGLPLRKETRDTISQLCAQFNDGLYDVGIDLPGTALRRGINARARLQAMLWPEMKDRAAAIAAKYTQADDATLEADTPMTATTTTTTTTRGSGYIDMLEAQLRAAAPFYPIDRSLVVDRAMGNVIATADTTRHMMFGMVVCVCLVPRVKAKLLEEQEQVIAQHGEAVTGRVLSCMAYMDAAIKEAMRLLPASNGAFRQLLKPLQVAGHTLPAGTNVYINSHMQHVLDPAVMSGDVPQGGLATNANGLPAHMDYLDGLEEAYKPERWLDELTRPRSYATFGAGTHMCLGVHAAYAEAKLLLLRLLRDYDFELEDKDVLAKCTAHFPGPTPAAGTDWLRVRAKVAA